MERSASRSLRRHALISDTHNQHSELVLPGGDVLIHAGNVSGRGSETEIRSFLNWFSSCPHPHKIFIAGNHDFFFEQASPEHIRAMIPEGIIYLNDSGAEIGGLRYWGSPVTSWFYDWAFNRERGAEIKAHWDLIPANTDVLITHGPPELILDTTTRGVSAGCADLHETIERIRPGLHVFGHIHEGAPRKPETTPAL